MLTQIRYAQWMILAGVLAFNSPVPAEPTDEHLIKIGSFLSLTGSAALLGEPAYNTLAMYIEQINAQGGVLGKELAWVCYDAGDDAEKARTAVKRLIEQDNVDLIIGGSTTGTALAVIPLVERAGIPFISLAGGEGITEPVRRWVFKIPPTDRMAIIKIFEDLQQRAIHRIALISSTDGFGSAARQQAKALASGYGIGIVADEIYHSDDHDTLAQLIRIRGAPGVQAVLNLGTGQGPVTVTRHYRQLDLPWPLYQSHGAASPQYIEWGQVAVEGVRLPAGLLMLADRLPDGHPQKALLNDYRNAYQWRYQGLASPFGGYAYDALMIAVEAIKRAGTTAKEQVREALENTRNYVGVTGGFNLSPTDHLGLCEGAFTMTEIRRGEFIAIDREEMSEKMSQDDFFDP